MSSNPVPKENEESNLIEHTVFPLQMEPGALIISIHIQNLYATFGEQYVKNTLQELFLTESSTCPSTSDSKS